MPARRKPKAATACVSLPVLAALTVLLAACSPSATPSSSSRPANHTRPLAHDALNVSNAWGHLTAFVALGPRDAGTPGARQAAAFLVEQLRTLGLSPERDTFDDPTPSGTQTFHNVYATIPGHTARPPILLMSHFDTKTGIGDPFQGANDSGSSTALLLELARVAAAAPRPLPVPLMFAFLDGEECAVRYGPIDGLHGSRHLLERIRKQPRAQLPQAVILLDMIGDADLNIALPANCDRTLIRLTLEAAHRMGTRRFFSTSRHGMVDDHKPFHDAGIPAINLIDFKYGSTPGANDYWHTTEDSLDKLSPKSLEIVGHVVLELLNTLFEETPTP